MTNNLDRYGSAGGIMPLIGIWVQPWLIELTNFWLNPKVAITDKYQLTLARINVMRGLFAEMRENGLKSPRPKSKFYYTIFV